MEKCSEQWRSVVGYEGLYEVSDDGRVRSKDRVTRFRDGRVKAFPGRAMRLQVGSDGRMQITLCRDGEERRYQVHALVLAAFVGPRPPGKICCHGDGDPTNNSVGNLRWDTYSANLHDSVRHGTHTYSKRSACGRGHEFTAENTNLNGPKRRCRTCSREYVREYKARKRSEAQQLRSHLPQA